MGLEIDKYLLKLSQIKFTVKNSEYKDESRVLGTNHLKFFFIPVNIYKTKEIKYNKSRVVDKYRLTIKT